MATGTWSEGDIIIYRGRWNGFIYWALPVTVVYDSNNLVVLYWPAGTPVKRPKSRVTIQELNFRSHPPISDCFWTDTDILMLCNIGKPYSINRMVSAKSGGLLCWYINLQAPLQRIGIGFETEDHLLDVVFEPDLSSWKLKDEDELSEAVSLGLYNPHKEEEIRKAASDAVTCISSGYSPITEKWMTWTPPSSWAIPKMPENWNT